MTEIDLSDKSFCIKLSQFGKSHFAHQRSQLDFIKILLVELSVKTVASASTGKLSK